MSAALAIELRKRLGTFLLNVAFQAPAGFTALFGPSGAGKTLTLRCVAGLLRPDGGRVLVDGRVLFDSSAGIDVPVQERRVGYVFQQYALFPHLSVSANVAFGLHGLPRPAREARVAELLALVGLDGFGARYPRELSGGQQQRVALARALAPRPDAVLLDEPFAAVDALVRKQLRRELRLIHERTGTPMVLVTHDLAEVQQLADWMVLYDQGHVLQAGAPAQVLDAPAEQRVAELLEAGR